LEKYGQLKVIGLPSLYLAFDFGFASELFWRLWVSIFPPLKWESFPTSVVDELSPLFKSFIFTVPLRREGTSVILNKYMKK